MQTTTDTASPASSGLSPDSSESSSSVESGSFSNRLEAAWDRAEASINSDSTDNESSQEQTADDAASDDQAPDPAKAGDSSQEDGDTSGATDDDPSGSDDGNADDQDDSRSTEPLAAPDSWASDRKDEFGKLDPRSQKLVLDFYEDMNGGVNKALKKLADERNAMRDNFGVETSALKELVETGRQFEQDPISVLQKLAEQAGVPVFFTPQTDEQVPQFESQEEQSRWLLEATRRQAKADAEADRRREAAQRDSSEKIKQELADALDAHPDLPEHRDAVVGRMAEGGVTAMEAYRLLNWDKVAEMAREGQNAAAEVEKLRAENERLKKAGTRPPAKETGDVQSPDDEKLDAYERAYRRAQRAKAQR
ncbi:MAG: hypothetical protein B0D91_00730 [Oceanospirillales bacterium LUC14_002_19_P2]|nr:MAG: hypothetical protein B0D91_00730 [Oceanospirillales bacterium LUC14_002_19_P2]